MASLIIHHKVRDYAAWRSGYDAHESSRGIVIAANVSDPATARDWMAGDDLKAAMQKAGVLGAPTIHLIG